MNSLLRLILRRFGCFGIRLFRYFFTEPKPNRNRTETETGTETPVSVEHYVLVRYLYVKYGSMALTALLNHWHLGENQFAYYPSNYCWTKHHFQKITSQRNEQGWVGLTLFVKVVLYPIGVGDLNLCQISRKDSKEPLSRSTSFAAGHGYTFTPCFGLILTK